MLTETIIEFTSITKNNNTYLYPYELSTSTFNNYVNLGILDNSDKQYFKLID